jgi:hypothetical protein
MQLPLPAVAQVPVLLLLPNLSLMLLLLSALLLTWWVSRLQLGQVPQQRGLLTEVLEAVLADVQLVARRVRLRVR